MPPSVAVSFVEQATCDGLSEREMMLLSKFEHAAHGFLSFRLASCGWSCLDGRLLSERKQKRFKRHAASIRARNETRFKLGPQVKGDGHGNLSSEFTPAESSSLMTWVPSLLLSSTDLAHRGNWARIDEDGWGSVLLQRFINLDVAPQHFGQQ